MIQPARSKATTAADKLAIKARAETGIALMERIFSLSDDQLIALMLGTSEAEAKTIRGPITDSAALLIKMPNAHKILSAVRTGSAMRTKRARFKKRLHGLAVTQIGSFAADSLTDLANHALDGYLLAVVLPEGFTPAQRRAMRRPFERAVGN
jgi:hypothetical protein